MKKKTIKKILDTKFQNFVSSITDEKVRSLVENNSIITGGAIASMLMGYMPNDYDIYFTNKETVKAVAEYYSKKFNKKANDDEATWVIDGANLPSDWEDTKGSLYFNMSSDRIKIGIKGNRGVAKELGLKERDDEELAEFSETPPENQEGEKYRPVYITSNAISLSGQVQVILRFYGDPNEIHQHYDYIHCTNFWLSKGKELTLKQPALEAILAKELIYVGSKYPIASIIRTRKFIKRGFSITAGQYLKMAYQVSLLDLNSIEVLEDQLTGIDALFFTQIIDELKKQKEKNPYFTYDQNYLSTIIDKFFN